MGGGFSIKSSTVVSKGNYLVTGLILGMALAQFATAVVFTIRSFHLRVGQADEITTLASTALSLGVATDIFTAASLSYFLHRMRTGYKKYACGSS
jgi:hypothetical protein